MLSLLLKAFALSLAISTAIFAVSIYLERRRGVRRPIRDHFKEWIQVLLAFTVLFSLGFFLEPIVQPIDDALDRYPARVMAAGIFISVFLFALRKRRQDIYGMLEIAIALLILYTFAVNPYSGLIAFLVGFATPVYIIIRGLDNIDKCSEQKKPSDPVVSDGDVGGEELAGADAADASGEGAATGLKGLETAA